VEFMLLFTTEARLARNEGGCAEMKKFAEELAREGKLRRGAPLGPGSAAAAVSVRDGKPFVTDGPFAETKEQLGGFWVIDVPDRAAALEIARRIPHAQYGTVEVSRVRVRYSFLDAGEGRPFLLAFRQDPGLRDPLGSKMREMVAHGRELEDAGVLIETAPLADDPPRARVATRDRKVIVTDGPFAETKDVVGGYSLVRAADRAAAIEIAKRYPAARWGDVEVREIIYFDDV
jgi:hypothetical protein